MCSSTMGRLLRLPCHLTVSILHVIITRGLMCYVIITRGRVLRPPCHFIVFWVPAADFERLSLLLFLNGMRVFLLWLNKKLCPV